jgi:nucleoside-diphosphate-sugar epimerase
MAVFITGGHGHIGSWAARYLANQGEKVILFDTHPVTPDCLMKVSGDITFIRGDVMDFPHLTEIFRQYKGKIDGILHTVGVMGELVLNRPHFNVNLNITGTHNILEIARLFEIPKVVYTSTGAVYGAVSGTAAENQYLPNPLGSLRCHQGFRRIFRASVCCHFRLRFQNQSCLFLLWTG